MGLKNDLYSIRRTRITPENEFNTSRQNRNKTVAAIFALIFGSLGIHRFYLGKAITGFLYLLFCWTFVPAILGFIECILLLLMNDNKFYFKYNHK